MPGGYPKEIVERARSRSWWGRWFAGVEDIGKTNDTFHQPVVF